MHGLHAGENRVHRLCRIAGMTASHHRKKGKSGKAGPAPHDDLLAVVDRHGVIRREFAATRPNQVWLWDISEHPTREGKLYLCAIKDVHSNQIVGYSIDGRMKSSLAAAAMRNAIALRSPTGTICHSDRGGQGGFSWSSQHFDLEVFGGSSTASCGQGDSSEAPVSGASEVPAGYRGGVLGAGREGATRRGSGARCRRRTRGGRAMVPPRWRYGALRYHPAAVGPLPLVR
ncbi:hypothetical protein GCM10027282_27810 [Frigoribacterium salinisoli]